MKKHGSLLAVFLAVLMLTGMIPSGFVPYSRAGAQVLGDADGDGKITAADARLVLRTAVGLEKTPEDITLLDVDADGQITAADARLVLRYAVGLETSFPAAEKLAQTKEEPVETDPADYAPKVFSNFKGDTSKLKNDPDAAYQLRYSPSIRLQCVTTFHWNYGRGAKPGKIWIREVDSGKTYGPWDATGRRFNGVDNAVWDVFLDDFDWKAYTAYEVLDSDPATRSYTEGVGNPIFELRGWRDWPAVAPMLKKQGGFSGGKAGPASGKISYGELTVDFGKTFDGDAVLMDDRSGVSHDDPDFKVYDLLLTGDSINSISISLDAAQPKKNEAYQLQVGIPVKDDDKEGTLWFDLDTEWKNGKATAEAYPAFSYDQLGDVSFGDGKSLTSAMYDLGTKAFDLSMLPLDLLDDGVNAAVDLGDKSIKMWRLVLKRVRLYHSGDFLLALPVSLDKVTDEGARLLLDDMNGILNVYRKEYDIHRDKWPMTVNVGWMCPPLEGGDAFFAMPMLSLGGRIGRNQVGINNSYMKIDKELLSYHDYRFAEGKYDESSAFLYSTLAHELFHFVQRNYVSKGRTGLWVDESSAAYVGTEMMEQIGVKKYHDQNYLRETRMQFDMLRKTLSISETDEMDPSYISPVLFDFLTKIDPHALRKLYETLRDGSMFSSWAAVLEKATGTPMRMLALKYYLYLDAGALFAKEYEGWYLTERAMDPKDHRYDDLVEVIDLEDWMKTKEGAHSFSIGPYGVHFIVLKKSVKIGPMDRIVVEDLPKDIAVTTWGSHQTYQPDKRFSGGWEHYYSGGLGVGTSDNYIIYAFMNGSGTNYGGWFGKKAAFTYTYRTDREVMLSYDFTQESTMRYPEKNGDLVSTDAPVSWLYFDMPGGRRTEYNDQNRGESHAEMDINGDAVTLKLYDDKGKTLYSGSLKYDKKSGVARNADCALQFSVIVPENIYMRQTDRVWGNIYRSDGGRIRFLTWADH